MSEEEKKERKILQDYYDNLSATNLKLLEKHTDWASSLEEQSTTFSQFLTSLCAALLAIFFSVEDFNDLIIRHSVFNWAAAVYLVSFLIYTLYSKEKIDHDSLRLVQSNQQNEENFQKAFRVLEDQFKNGIDIKKFYKDIEILSKENKRELTEIDGKMGGYTNYLLELYIFLLLVTFWLVFFSTTDFCTSYLYVGIVLIFCITHNQNRYLYGFVKIYSKLVSKIFPVNEKPTSKD